MAKHDNISGHPGYYMSKRGHLYSRILPGNHKLGSKYVKKSKYSLSNGKYVKYYRVVIQGQKYYVHRLVAQIYLPNPDNLPCVAHKNNNPLDNRVSNLYWCTQQENMIQMVEDGRSLKGPKNPSWKFRDMEKIGDFYAEGVGVIEICRLLDLSKHIVQKSIQILFKELWDTRK